MLKFEIFNEEDNARTGVVRLRRGEISTPAFMPVGTNATIKAMSPDEMKEKGSEIVLGNEH